MAGGFARGADLAAGWSLAAAPAGASVDLCKVWGAQGLDVQAFRDGVYVSCARGPLMSRAGEAYWVYARRAAALDTGAPASAPVAVSLKPGWNIIGNPFDKALSWDGDILVDGGAARASAKIFPLLIHYNSETGGYETTTAMAPGRGYIVLARAACSLTLPVPGEDPVVIAFEPLDPALVATDPETGLPYIAGQMVAQRAGGVSGAQFEAALAAQGFTVLGRNTYLGLYQVQAPAGSSDAAALALLEAAPETAAAVRHWILSPGAYVPDDPPWQGGPPDQRWAFERVHAPEAWSMAAASGPAIAVVDTGVDGAHPDLAGRVSGGADFITPGGDGATDPDGHGTHVAGIMAAAMDNATGIAGVCPRCAIVPVRVCDAGLCPFFSVMNGVVYAANAGARIINLSIEGQGQPGSPEWRIFQNVIDYATARGAFVVAAAGNGGGSADAVIPAALNGVYAVGATGRDDMPASFSNNSLAVDLFAPGVDIYSLEPGGATGMRQGTSMAAAFVSGAAGLIAGIAPTVTSAEIQDVLREQSNPLGPLPSYNGGLLDLDRALRQFSAGNQAPVIDALELSQVSIAPGGSISATVRARDADNDFLEYEWTVTGGALNGGARDTKTWSGFPDRGAYRVAVTVTDGHGGSATANAVLNVGLDGLAYIDIYPHVASVERGGIVAFKAQALFKDGNTYPVRPLWSVDSGLGVMAPDGTFTALSAGVETVRAQLNGLSGAMSVAIDTALPPPALKPAAMTQVAQVPALSTANSNYVVLGDVDGDGDNDFIALSGIGSPNQTHKNSGAGASFAQTAFSVNSSVFMGALGDMESDGDLDLVEAGFNTQPGVRIFENDGSGGFTLGGTLAAANNVLSVAVRDMDNDGDLDIVAGLSGGANPVSVFWNVDGVGFDGTRTDLVFACNLKHAVVGDVNKDGWMDVVSACGDGGISAQWWRNDQSGGFTSQGALAGTSLTTYFADLADVDGDDDPDYLALRQYNDAGTDYEEIRIFKNDGAGSFTDSGATPRWVVGTGARQFALADHDNDGDIDIYAATRSASGGLVYVNNGSGAFGSFTDSFSAPVSAVYAGDLSGDRGPDVIIPDQTGFIWRNNTANAAPPAPASLSHEFVNPNQVRLSWTWAPGADTTSAAQITFDLTMLYDDDFAVGPNTPVTVISGVAAERQGLIGHATRSGNTFYYVTSTHGSVTGEAQWNVRAVDAGFGRGAWSAPETIGCPVVSSLADTGMATLRDCIDYANGIAGNATITFSPSIYGGTISLTSPLPEINQSSIAVDGRFADITLDGSSCAGCSGLTVSAGDNARILGLTIQNFDTFGINITNGASNATIGGKSSSGAGNVIINNALAGIQVEGSIGPLIQGNAIGTNFGPAPATGTVSLGNGYGIWLNDMNFGFGVQGAKIGTSTNNTDYANVIAYNTLNGIYINQSFPPVMGGATMQNQLYANSIYSNGGLTDKAIRINNSLHGNISPPTISNVVCSTNPGEYDVTYSFPADSPTASTIYFYRATNSGTPAVASDTVGGEGYAYLNIHSGGAAGVANTVTLALSVSAGDSLSAYRYSLGAGPFNFRGFSEFGNNRDIPSCGQCPGWIVTNNAASGDGSLYACIAEANSTGGQPTITFDAAYTIQPDNTHKLILTDNAGAIIDGDVNGDGAPDVTIDGAGCIDCHGFTLSSNNNTIKNLNIINFDDTLCNLNNPRQCAGIYLTNAATGNTVRDNNIGNTSGTTAHGNHYGVFVSDGASSNTIGPGNVISGNEGTPGNGNGHGVYFNCRAAGTVCSNNTVSGNIIGLNGAGDTALANDGLGIYLDTYTTATTVGGTSAATRNIISGNVKSGININGTTVSNNIVTGNYIGTDINGLNDMPNENGVILNTTTAGNRIGGNIDTERNIISGNGNWGVFISGLSQTANNKIQGNFIGVDATGKAPLANGTEGIEIQGGSYNFIGSDMDGLNDSKEGNVIGGNGSNGIHFNNTQAQRYIVAGNYIGMATDSSTAIPNTLSGVSIVDGHHNLIGSATDTAYANVIAENGSFFGDYGVHLENFTSDNNAILHNRIFNNFDTGIHLNLDGANNDLAAPSIDTVTLAGGSDYDILGSSTCGPDCTVELFVVDNGSPPPTVNADGSGAGEAWQYVTRTLTGAAGGWSFTGLTITGGTRITATITDTDTASDPFGSTSEFAANVLLPVSLCPNWLVTTTVDTANTSGSLRECIKEANTAGGGQTIQFDAAMANQTIAPNSTGAGALPAITKPGIIIDGTTRNVTLSGASCAGCDGLTFNTATGNNGGVKNLTIVGFDDGILIDGVSGTTVSGCKIGNNGAAATANNKGISMVNGATGSTIGGSAAADANIISGNTTAGVSVTSSNGNTIKRNSIGVDSLGSGALANGTGIILNAASYNTIGGSTAANAGNVIGFNTAAGIRITNGAGNNYIYGNYIGIDSALSLDLGNPGAGISVETASTHNFIGATDTIKFNYIAHNNGHGIALLDAGTDFNALHRNILFDNTLDGISISNGGNSGISPPAIACSQPAGGASYWIMGTSTCGAGCDVELFQADRTGVAADAPAGEAAAYLGTGVTDATGSFGVAVTFPSVAGGTRITGTITDANGNTSEFADNYDLSVICDLCPNGVVTDTGDSATTPGTLRACIAKANSDGGPSTISFSLGGPATLNIGSTLLITNEDSTTITATGSIILDGGGSVPNMLEIKSSSNTIKGLTLRNFSGRGIKITTGGPGCSNNTIGGSGLSQGNTIIAAGNHGLEVDGATCAGNTLSRNIIYESGLAGINLALGANNNVNRPSISCSTNNGGGSYTVEGTTTPACNACTIELFQTDNNTTVLPDDAFNGEALAYLGTATTDATGNFSAAITFPHASAPAGKKLTATLTDNGNNTSRFAVNYAIIDNPTLCDICPNLEVTNVDDDGVSSLRACIEKADGDGAASLITVNLGAVATNTITLASPLPALTEAFATTINGNGENLVVNGGFFATDGLLITSANNMITDLSFVNFASSAIHVSGPGATGNTITKTRLGEDFAGSAGPNEIGILITGGADASTIGGAIASRNVIVNSRNHGIHIEDSDDTIVRGNHIGVSYDGTTVKGNGGNGVDISNAARTIIGGNYTTNGNVIGGSAGPGISLSAAPNTAVKGNFIGMQNGGASDFGNAGPGVGVQNSSDVVIGGTGANERNFIGHNGGDGIYLDNSSNAAIHDNYIGTGSGNNDYQNAGNGIQLVNGSSHTAIGASGFGNLIAFNGGAGVLVDGAAAIENTILYNRIYKSGGLGIDLASGANQSVATPTITYVFSPSANVYDINLTVAGPPVDCSAGSPCTVQVFAVDSSGIPNVSPDAAGGEAFSFATSQQVTTSCSPNCTVSFTGVGISAGPTKITATITDGNGNTSEFSANYPLPTTSTCPVVSVLTDARPNPPAGSLRDCIKRANTGGAAYQSISFSESLNNQTILLGSALDNSSDSSAISTSNISIIARATQSITVSGAGLAQNCFVIQPVDATVVSGIEIAGLSIHNCNIGISVDKTSASPVVQNVTIRDNYIGVNRNGTVYDDTNYGLRLFHVQSFDIHDNVIAGNKEHGIWIRFIDSSDIDIHDNYIGTDTAGTPGIGNKKHGIVISEYTHDVLIENNVISGNGTLSTHAGIWLPLTNNVSVINNRIGVNDAGTAAIPNRTGIFMNDGTHHVTIGGSTAAGEGNIISGNTDQGIYMSNVVDLVTITGNRIGVDVNGDALGNGSHGIQMSDTTVTHSTIGNQSQDLANIIAHNGTAGVGHGITLAANSNQSYNMFSQNRIFNNEGKGLDVPVGSNESLRPPIITSVMPLVSPGAVQISGTANYNGGLPCVTCRVEVFRVDHLPATASDTSGAGEAYEYLGSITTNAAGAWASNSFAFATASGEWITATVTDGLNNTSEFATNATVNYCPSVRSYYDSGANTLRECITQANSAGGVYKDIDFHSGMAGKTIALNTALPGLAAGGITINNTSGGEITVDGQGGNFNCLTMTSANNEIHDLSIVRCAGAGGPAAISISTAAATGNVISRNKIGTNNASAANLGNSSGVMILDSASNNTVSANTITASSNDGVVIKDSAHHNTVAGNTITNNGKSGMGHGVRLESGAANNTLGGSGAGLPNAITGNASAGVSAHGAATMGNDFTENVIHSNGYLGIALENGANNSIAQPVISTLTITGVNTFNVIGDGPAANPCAGCVVELFRVDDTLSGVATDSSGAGEAYALVATGTTSATGAYAFFGVTMSGGSWFTVTVTDSADGTSEFSINKQAVNDPPYFVPATLAFTTDNGIVPDGTDDFKFSIEAVDPNGLLDLTNAPAGVVLDLSPIFGASVALTNTLAVGANGGYVFESASHTAFNAAGVATGTYALFATVTDQWGGTGATTIDILILNATPTVSNPAVSQAAVIPGDIVTISADAADFNGLSDIQSVTVDLQAINGAASEPLAHTGGGAYATSGYVIPAGAPFGNYTIIITALDKSGAWATASFALAVGGAPTVVSVTFAPASVPPDGTTSANITVEVSDPDGAGDIARVYIVLDPIKTTPVTLNLVQSAPGSFFYTGAATVDPGFASGPYTITAWASDSTALSDSGDGVLYVTNLPPDITATTVTPYDVAPGITGFDGISFTATVVDPNGPGDIDAVTMDLSPLGGPSEFRLYDDGLTGGDAAVDGVYTFSNYTVPAAALFGTYTLIVSATDGDATSTADIVMRVNSPPAITNMEFVPDTTLADGVTPVTLRIDVADADGRQDIQSVVADLTSLGLGSPVPLVYSGPAGASFRYTASVTPTAGYPVGIYTATGTVTDIFTRAASTTADLEIVSKMPVAPVMVSVTSSDSRATVTLRTPFLNTDGSPLTNLDHINIWRRTSSGAYGALPQDTIAITATNTVVIRTDAAVTDFETYCYQASAVNATTQESARSAEMCVTIYPPAWVYEQTCGDVAAHGFPVPSTPGFFNRPMDVAVDQLSGHIFVADTDNHRIQKFDKDCVFLGATGTFGSTPGKFKTPGGITLMNDKLYVIDRYDRVQVFDKDLNVLPDEEFPVAGPVTIEGDGGFLYITTTIKNTLVKYDTAGVETASYTLTMPRAVDIDSAGNIYVTDVSENKVYVLDSSGAVLTSWGGPGTALGQFNQPFGIAVGTAQSHTGALQTLVFVSDTQNNRIQIFDTSGNLDNFIFYGVGMDYGQLRYPMGLDLSPSGQLSPTVSLIVADRYNSRVQEFGPPTP